MAIRLIAILLLSHLVGIAVHAQDVKTGKFEYLKGQVGNIPVTMFLCSGAGDDVASYYYDRVQRPIVLFSTKDSSVGIRFFGGDDEVLMNAAAGGYSGTLKTGEPAKTFPLRLRSVSSPYTFDVYAISSSKKIDPKKEKSGQFIYSLSTIWPRGDAPRPVFIARQIGKLIGMKDDGKTSLKSFMQEGARVVPKDLLDEYDIESTIKSQVQVFVSDLTNDFLSLTVWDYSYQGGAHGGSAENFANLDLKNLRALGFEDVFRNGSEKGLLTLLEKAYRFDKKLKPEEPLSAGGLFEDHLTEASKTILINGKGVVFHYGQYEIAPYSEGMIEIFLPWSELKPYLTPSFAQRLAEGL